VFTVGDIFGALTLAVVAGVGAWYGRSWGINTGELIACLGELRRPANANRVLREVRSRELLLEHPEAPAAVRDILLAITFIPRKGGPLPSFGSRAFGEWMGTADHDRSWFRYIDGVPDELGRLLEELEREGEIPVA